MGTTRRKLRRLLDETTDSRTYNIAVSHYPYIDYLDDKKNPVYNTYWRSRPYRNWKNYRSHQWKPKITSNEEAHNVSPCEGKHDSSGHAQQLAHLESARQDCLWVQDLLKD